MLNLGISIYPGMNFTMRQAGEYLIRAKHRGYSRLFTSLHIPEVNPKTMMTDFQSLTHRAVELGFEVTADISPYTFRFLSGGTNAKALDQLGIQGVRIDFGFSPAEIAGLTHATSLHIEINASVCNRQMLQSILSSGANVERLRAGHNYYPRPDTGLSYEFFAQRSLVFKEFGIPVSVFLPSLKHPRGPIGAGLPTLEAHRRLSPSIAAKQFALSDLADTLIIGDSDATDEELSAVSAVDRKCLELSVEAVPQLSPVEREIIFATHHTNRLDPGEKIIRSQEARLLCTGSILARPPFIRARGSITIDNEAYMRYMGELQILLEDFPGDPRVNLVGYVAKEEQFLIDMIGPGCVFRLKEAKVR